MPELTIQHSYAEGTTLTGSRKGDGLYQLLRSHGWVFRRSVGDFRLLGSVDKPAKQEAIDRTVSAVEQLGFTVAVTIDNTIRSMEDQEADRAARAEDRAARLEYRAGRIGHEAESRRAAAERVFDSIPMGQPMLVDHYSYKADRNRRERAWNNLGKSIKLGKQAGKVVQQAETAAHHMDYRHTPETVANRITKLEADRHRVQRSLDGYTRNFRNSQGAIYSREEHAPATGTHREDLEGEGAHLDEQLRYWRKVREQQINDGKATNYTRGTIKKGDLIKHRGCWYPVERVNKVSVSVPSIVGGSWTDTMRYEHITDHCRPNDERWRAAAVAAMELACRMSHNPKGLHKAYKRLKAELSKPAN